jgi:predicted transcriptional regulator
MKLELTLGTDDLKIKRIGKALGVLKRLEILQLITKDASESLNYGEIAKGIDRSPTAVTNNMSWLRQSGLIEDLIIEGRRGKMQKIPKLKYNKIIINLK